MNLINDDQERIVAPFVSPYDVPLHLNNIYGGHSAFLTLSGPSLKDMPLEKLNQPGILTMGVNNSPSIFRPNLWACVDTPDRFLRNIWYDPTIMKFVDSHFFNMPLWDNINKKILKEEHLAQCPNVVGYFKRHEAISDTWLHAPFMDWGLVDKPYVSRSGATYPGHRSVMLVAIKILIIMGVRRIYIVGADFNMQPDKAYAFDESANKRRCDSNNLTYVFLNAFLDDMRIEFKRFGVQIFNCTPKGNLKTLPRVPFTEAIKFETEHMNEYLTEPTKDMYMDIKKKRKLEKIQLHTSKGNK